MAYEAGIRGQPTEKLSWDLAVFLNDYDRLIFPLSTGAGGSGPIVIIPMPFRNVMRGDTYGCELAANYKVTPAWKVRAAYSFLVMDLQPLPGSPNPDLGRPNPAQRALSAIVLRPRTALATRSDRPLCREPSEPSAVPKYIVGDVPPGLASQRSLGILGRGPQLGQRQVLRVRQRRLPCAIATEVGPEVYGQLAWRY